MPQAQIMRAMPRRRGLGLEVDASLLAWGIGILALGAFLLGGREVPKARAKLKAVHRRSTQRAIARLESKIERLRAKDRNL